ncbi:MAG: hypothetical protein ONB48_14905 [candidate division KSB1 bacterium]|nr:hypothetical protein [candidate division KSB1 bacterium]MDZ7273472.1 hypothetical protein [candidate division KSB1 bacterium]MDZ7286936.1 hypothetical protein [candidate division KSB1 bacterium]MDZ7299711.1 hypothetical protein [candidate division KSB1 bacterium]MDZ7305650.1 hypothetical protein [candidate division KSB1 bacterium]
MSKHKNRAAAKPAENCGTELNHAGIKFMPENGPAQSQLSEQKQVDGIWVLLVFAILFLFLMVMGWWAS